MRTIEGRLADLLEEAALNVAPQEAVGLLTITDRVIMLPNHADEPGSNFTVYRHDILNAIRMNEIEDLAELTLWHSHPNGGVGPSRIDMQQRLPHFEHLVVTLDSGRVLFTWY